MSFHGLNDSPRLSRHHEGAEDKQRREQEDPMTAAASMLRELRSKYLMERKELSTSVAAQVREITIETLQLKNGQNDCERQVEHLLERMNYIEQQHDIPDLQGATTEASQRLAALSTELKSFTEEAQLLKVALLDDQTRRETKTRELELEDQNIQLRIGQLEDQNEFLRAELQRIRLANAEPMDEAISLLQSMSHSDAPSAYSSKFVEEMQAAADQKLTALEQEHLAVEGKVASIEKFCSESEARHNKEVVELHNTISKIEKQQQKVQDRVGDRTLQFSVESHPQPPAFSPPPPQQVQHELPVAAASLSNRQRLHDFYSVYNPNKLPQLDAILEEYEGAEHELFSALETHYGAFGYFSMY